MEPSQNKVCVHLKVEGRVQGVYFRAATVAQARKLRVTGWVMNCADGSVEAVAEGRQTDIEELIVWCHHGPAGARVSFVEVRYESLQDEFQGFSIKK